MGAEPGKRRTNIGLNSLDCGHDGGSCAASVGEATQPFEPDDPPDGDPGRLGEFPSQLGRTDDDPTLRLTTRHKLQPLGAAIDEAPDGQRAMDMLARQRYDLVVLDEINIALRYDYLDINEVVRFLREEKPPMTHVCLTGRNAKEELIEIADLVTEMTLVKHPFRSGIKAQVGVEF